MKTFAAVLGAILTLVPTTKYLVDLAYRVHPSLEHSVCRSVLCTDESLLEAADRFAGNNDVAIANLKEALRRNPASPDRWCDLGEALLNAGRIEEAQYCFMRAIELGPQNPPAFWRTAQFYSRIGEPIRMQQYMGKMLELLPQYRNVVFDVYLSKRIPVLDALEYGIPKQPRVEQEYFYYLLAHNVMLPDVKKAWQWLNSHSATEDKLAGDYVDLLLKKGEYSSAAEVWKQSVGRRDEAYLKSNLVFNGGFETEPLQSGLDWRFLETPGAVMRRDSSVAFSGSSSLRIDFDGKNNIDFSALAHPVVASPGHYHFNARIRTAALTTDQGIGFRISDSSGRINLQTPRLTGTHDWTPTTLDFTLSGPVQLLRIEVVRQPSWKFDNKISGTAWIDAVSLVRS